MTEKIPSFLPYGRHDVNEDDIAAVSAVLQGDWLTTGPMVAQFEAAVAARVGARHAIACSNGSTALHLAALGVGLSPGQVAVVPAVTFLATASAVLQTGAEVIFADVDPETALMGPQHLEAALDRGCKIFPDAKVTCVLPVHMAGRAVAMGQVAEVARAKDLAIIEDAAHAIGTVSPDGAVGACRHSNATIFSFHPVKTMTTCEGGAVTTNDDQVASHLKRLRNHGMIREPADFTDQEAGFDGGAPNPWYYEMDEPGFNYRIPDIQCALGLSQLNRLDAFIAHRRAIHEQYRMRFDEIDGVTFTAEEAGAQTSWHLAVALIDFKRFGISRGQVMRKLTDHGIGSQVHYIPLYRQPFYRKRYGEQSLPGAEAYYARALSLPLHARMGTGDANHVVDVVLNTLNAAR